MVQHSTTWFQEKFFIFSNLQWSELASILLLAIVLIVIGRLLVNRFLLKKFKDVGVAFPSLNLGRRFHIAFALVIISAVWIIGVPFFDFTDKEMAIFLRVGHIVLAVNMVWLLFRSIEIASAYFEHAAQVHHRHIDKAAIHVLRRGSKLFFGIIGALYIAQSLTINVTSLLAGLGIGGLAVALAAKETLSNLMGSFTVLLDRPFEIGDWVKIGNDIEGDVEEVGLRSTRIRTFANSVVVVPNGNLINQGIENFSKRRFRRLKTMLHLELSTPPEKVDAFCDALRMMVMQHPLLRRDFCEIHLNEIGPYSLDILFYVFIETANWTEELSERHTILSEVLANAKKVGVTLIPPTQAVELPSTGESRSTQPR